MLGPALPPSMLTLVHISERSLQEPQRVILEFQVPSPLAGDDSRDGGGRAKQDARAEGQGVDGFDSLLNENA